jgi:hypothetical protein
MQPEPRATGVGGVIDDHRHVPLLGESTGQQPIQTSKETLKPGDRILERRKGYWKSGVVDKVFGNNGKDRIRVGENCGECGWPS